MLTILSSASGPGSSKRCLPTDQHRADADRQQQDQGEDGVADDDDRMAHAPRSNSRRRRPHALRLKRRARRTRRIASRRRVAVLMFARGRMGLARSGSKTLPCCGGKRRIGIGTFARAGKRLSRCQRAASIAAGRSTHRQAPAFAADPITPGQYGTAISPRCRSAAADVTAVITWTTFIGEYGEREDPSFAH